MGRRGLEDLGRAVNPQRRRGVRMHVAERHVEDSVVNAHRPVVRDCGRLRATQVSREFAKENVSVVLNDVVGGVDSALHQARDRIDPNHAILALIGDEPLNHVDAKLELPLMLRQKGMNLIRDAARCTGEREVAVLDHLRERRRRVAQAHLCRQNRSIIRRLFSGGRARHFRRQRDIRGQQRSPGTRAMEASLRQLHRIAHAIAADRGVNLLHQWRIVQGQKPELSVDLKAATHLLTQSRPHALPECR